MRLFVILVTCFLAAALPVAPACAQGAAQDAGPLATAPGYWPINGDMECAERGAQGEFNGTVPGGWTGVRINTQTNPNVESALFAFGGMNCANDSSSIEKMQGGDSWVFKAPDLEETDRPGKAFDVAMFQQVPVTPGTAYTLSGWMVSLCGGSANPNDCPPGYYIAKMIGLDPTGGTNPTAPSVQWVENRTPHIAANEERIGWQNLRLSAAAQGATMTLFLRVNSPFQHHGNHAFVDAVRFFRAPTATFPDLPAIVNCDQFTVNWAGNLGPDLQGIPPAPYQLYFDIQYRLGEQGTWQTWLSHRGPGSGIFTAPILGRGLEYFFRAAPCAEQPDNQRGLWPVVPGVEEVQSVKIMLERPGPPRVYLPLTKN